jgi:tripartite ATP-independent transporter DctM subunit
MDPLAASLIIFGSLLALLTTGLPILFVMGSVAIITGLFLLGPQGLYLVSGVIYKNWSSEVLLASPFFVFSAAILERSGIADAAYGTVYRLFGAIRGGLASGTVLICTMFAAMVGISGAATVSMGLIALPSMVRRGYDKRMALGAIAAGGVLGIVIPPSVIMIIYAAIVRESVGGMFFGGVVPGMIIAFLHIILISTRSRMNPNLAPAIPPEERVSFREKLVSLRGLILPFLLISLILGVIYTGTATPTEAGAIAASGSLLCAAVSRKLTWLLLKESCIASLKLIGMVFWILAAAGVFNAVYITTGARDALMLTITGLQVNRWFIIIGLQLILLVFGCLMDDYAVVALCAPVFGPLVVNLGFNPLWWGILFILNMQIAYLTPPYGFNLFYMRGVIPQIRNKIPEDITMMDIYRGVLPYIGTQMLGLILVMAFPMLALWLPSTM